jgi:DNA-binding response OmpR family regulator
MTRTRPFQYSRLELDDESTEAFWDGQRLELSPESYMVLQMLARAPDKIHSRSDIREVTNIQAGDDDQAYVRQIKLIQFAFTKIISNRGYIEVVPRQGYKWSEPPPSIVKTLLGKFRIQKR